MRDAPEHRIRMKEGPQCGPKLLSEAILLNMRKRIAGHQFLDFQTGILVGEDYQTTCQNSAHFGDRRNRLRGGRAQALGVQHYGIKLFLFEGGKCLRNVRGHGTLATHAGQKNTRPVGGQSAPFDDQNLAVLEIRGHLSLSKSPRNVTAKAIYQPFRLRGAWAPPGPAGNDATDVIGCPGPISIREGMHSEIGERPDRHRVTEKRQFANPSQSLWVGPFSQSALPFGIPLQFTCPSWKFTYPSWN